MIGDEQSAVDPRHVDLPDLLLRGVPHPQPRQIAELDRLPRDRKRAGNDRLRGDDRRRRGEHDQRIKAPFGTSR